MRASSNISRFAGLLALVLLLPSSACLEPEDDPGETNEKTAGEKSGDASRSRMGGESTAPGRGAAGSAGSAGSSAAKGGADAGAESDPLLGDTGLHVSDVLGFYSGDWGDMILRQHGDEIWGAYTHDDGTIIGAIDADGVFVGWWSEVPSREPTNDAGDVEFRWARGTGTAVALDGRWRYGATDEWHDDWDVDLVTDRSPPASLSDRFSDSAAFKQHP